MIKGVKFASVPVSDQDKAIAFYTEKLGFTVATDLPLDDKQRWVELRIRGADTRLVLFTPDGHEDRVGTFQSITFLADDVRRTYDELVAKGVEFTIKPKTERWGTAAAFENIDGNIFVISSAYK